MSETKQTPARQVRSGTTIQVDGRAVQITDVRNVGGMMCLQGATAGMGNRVTMTVHPSDMIAVVA